MALTVSKAALVSPDSHSIPGKTGSVQSTFTPTISYPGFLDVLAQNPVLPRPTQIHVSHIRKFKTSGSPIKKINIKINFSNIFYVTQYYYWVSITPNIIISTGAPYKIISEIFHVLFYNKS